jgi:cytochrome P450
MMEPRAATTSPTGDADPPGAAAGRAAALAFDLNRLDRAFLDDPYPTYRALREYDPVHRMPDGSYFLTRYDDLVTVYHDVDTWSSDKRIDFKPKFDDSLLYEHHTTSLVFNDPPAHTRVRRLLAPTFAPRALKALQPRIEALVDRLLDRATERGSIDLIDEFAAAIPVQLIGDLLGIPQSERGPLRRWSLAILGALEPVLTDDRFNDGARSVAEFKDFLRDLIARRKRERVRDEGEILSTLIAGSELAHDTGRDDRLSELELLIGNSIDLLIRHPHALRDLAAHPELVPSAVEEFLRMESSNQLGNRRAAKDAVVSGTPIPAGTYVHLCIGAANRDPARFPDPDRLDIRRSPNRHLAFASGIHACAGLSLARMEAQVAIGKLLARFHTIERAGDYVRGGRARFRGFLHYPVALR